MIETNEENKTPEEIQLEIARLQSEKAASEVRLAEQERAARETRESNREIHYNQQFKAEMGKSGIRFEVDDTEELAKLITQTGCTLRSSADGRIIQALDSDGREIPVTKVFEKLALKYPFIVKDGTASHLKPRDPNGVFKTLSKSDFKTTASKAEYIRTEGLEKWEALPLHSTLGIEQDVDRVNAHDWGRMTLAQKSALVSTHGQEIVGQILARR